MRFRTALVDVQRPKCLCRVCAVIASVVALTAAGCNTTAGAGKDIQGLGEAVEGAA